MTQKTLTKGDHTTFSTTFKNAETGAVLDFSSGQSVFLYRFDDGVWSSVASTGGTLSEGTATYQFPDGIPESGLMEYRFQAEDSDSKKYTGNDIQRVRVLKVMGN